MTSKLTREKAQWLHDAREEAAAAGIKLTMNPNELLMFTSYALSAMDCEPVAEVVSIYGDPEAFGEREIRPLVGIQQMPYGTKLYRHAQPAPVVPEDVRHALSIMDDEIIAELDAEESACRAAMLQGANSPAIPDGYVMVPKEPTAEMQSAGASAIRFDTTAVNKLWTGNAVFRAMLAAAPQEVKGE
ncbi:TPA: hypothetical protein ACGEBJ_005518 [Klebsiella pneumoniae]